MVWVHRMVRSVGIQVIWTCHCRSAPKDVQKYPFLVANVTCIETNADSVGQIIPTERCGDSVRENMLAMNVVAATNVSQGWPVSGSMA